MSRNLMARWALVVFAAVAASSSVLPSASAALAVDLRCSELQWGTYPNPTTCGTSPVTSATPGQIYTTPSFAGNSGGNSFSGNASARADYGTLGVSAYANAINAAIGSGSADTRTLQLLTSARSEWTDLFTIGGIAGTYVDVMVDLLIHIEDLSQLQEGAMASAGYLAFNTSYSNPVNGWCWGGNTTACGNASPLVVGDNRISFVASILAGTTAPWMSSFYAEASVFNIELGSGTVDIVAMNTAHTYFTVLTPGATVQWASGNDYSVPTPGVPEPGTLALFGLGLAGLAASRRRPQ